MRREARARHSLNLEVRIFTDRRGMLRVLRYISHVYTNAGISQCDLIGNRRGLIISLRDCILAVRSCQEAVHLAAVGLPGPGGSHKGAGRSKVRRASVNRYILINSIVNS